jgi:pseudouridine-5'-phosphate glycosidase
VRNPAVALETTLVLHGVPRGEGGPLAGELIRIVRSKGANPALVGVVHGEAIVGLAQAELELLLAAEKVPKANTSNLGVLLHAQSHAATTVSTTMELASGAGVRVFATGGLGGLHKGLAAKPDISADLAAFTRFPVAVVTSGVKGLLDVVGTRELLETLGISVIGYRTSHFPAFYLRESAAGVDARFDDVATLASFVDAELTRTGRGIVVCNPVPVEHEIPRADWETWLAQAEASLGTTPDGRDVTPRLLAALHERSHGATLAANIALVKSNASLAAELAVAMYPGR